MEVGGKAKFINLTRSTLREVGTGLMGMGMDVDMDMGMDTDLDMGMGTAPLVTIQKGGHKATWSTALLPIERCHLVPNQK